MVPLFHSPVFNALSTPPRVYRQVASLVGLQLVTSFITVAKALGGQRETTQRQLNAEKKKRSDGPRVESLNKRLSMTHEKITMIEEMMRKIFTGLNPKSRMLLLLLLLIISSIASISFQLESDIFLLSNF